MFPLFFMCCSLNFRQFSCEEQKKIQALAKFYVFLTQRTGCDRLKNQFQTDWSPAKPNKTQDKLKIM